MQDKYDSTPDTLAHIRRVQVLLAEMQSNLTQRAILHDKSKLEEPEKSAFDEATLRLKGLTYGSEEYKAELANLKFALDHHYKNNSHHPEAHGGGVCGMSLMDLIEMLADWKAASERHADGCLLRSLEVNKKRFELSDQLDGILYFTAKEMKWIE